MILIIHMWFTTACCNCNKIDLFLLCLAVSGTNTVTTQLRDQMVVIKGNMRINNFVLK